MSRICHSQLTTLSFRPSPHAGRFLTAFQNADYSLMILISQGHRQGLAAVRPPRCQNNTNFLRASNTAPCNRQCGDGVACLQQHDCKRKVLQAYRNMLLELQSWANGQDMHRANFLSCTRQMKWHKRWPTYCTLTIERRASCQNIWTMRPIITLLGWPQSRWPCYVLPTLQWNTTSRWWQRQARITAIIPLHPVSTMGHQHIHYLFLAPHSKTKRVMQSAEVMQIRDPNTTISGIAGHVSAAVWVGAVNFPGALKWIRNLCVAVTTGIAEQAVTTNWSWARPYIPTLETQFGHRPGKGSWLCPEKIPGGLGRVPSTQRQLRGHDSESVGGSPWKDVMYWTFQ